MRPRSLCEQDLRLKADEMNPEWKVKNRAGSGSHLEFLSCLLGKILRVNETPFLDSQFFGGQIFCCPMDEAPAQSVSFFWCTLFLYHILCLLLCVGLHHLLLLTSPPGPSLGTFT